MNPQPALYERAALPLSYTGKKIRTIMKFWHATNYGKSLLSKIIHTAATKAKLNCEIFDTTGDKKGYESACTIMRNEIPVICTLADQKITLHLYASKLQDKIDARIGVKFYKIIEELDHRTYIQLQLEDPKSFDQLADIFCALKPIWR